MKKKHSLIALSLFFLLVGFKLSIPSWILNSSIVDLTEWYPRFGKAAFFFIHFLSPILLITLIIIFLWSVEKSIINLLSRIKISLKIFLKNKNKVFYTLVLLVLNAQFYYCFKYEEFYPAVMMPTFSNGIMDPIRTENTDVVIIKYINGETTSVRMKDFFTSVVGDEDVKLYAGEKILIDSIGKELKDWMRLNVELLMNRSDLLNISIIKKSITYHYNYYSMQKTNDVDCLLFKFNYDG